MHESPRKQTICPNCQHMLDEADNFCSKCGQENTTKVVSFGTLVYEVVSDFVSWDSRWFQTVVPFLFKPGALTNEFISGKRIRYMPPLRLYFFVSLICFTIIAYYTARENKTDERTEKAQQSIQADSIRNMVLKELPPTVPAKQRDQIQKALQNLTFAEKKRGLINNGNDSDDTSSDSVAKPPEPPSVSKRKKSQKDTTTITQDIDLDEEDGGQKIGEWALLMKLVKDPVLTEDGILDSLRWEKNYWNRMKVNRAMRMTNGNKEEFLAEMWDKAPIFMFMLLPFMALVMKFLYIRRKRLYIEHLIFMLHIHAFAFFAIAIDMILSNEFSNLNPSGVIVPLIVVYLWVAFYKVYMQGWFRTSFKLFTFLCVYSFNFFIIALVTVLIAAATY